MYFRLYVKKSGAFAKCKKCVCSAHLRQQGAPRKVVPCGLFRCYPSAHTACASGERGCPCCGTLRPAGRSPAPEQREDRGKTAAARRRRNVRHSAGRADTQTPQTRGRPRVCGVIGRAHAQGCFLAPAALLRRREEARGMTGRRWAHPRMLPAKASPHSG